MTQEQINLFLGLLASSPLVLYVVQQFFQRRKNKVDFGDDLLDTMNKTAASLKQAREDLTALEQEIRQADKEHAIEIAELEQQSKERQDTLERQWRERQDRMKTRVLELERTIVKYTISFTLTTHPDVQVTDLKVVGKEDAMESQKMRAIAAEKPK